MNGVSLGEKRRNSQDFPAAGLRWQAVLKDGPNTIRAVGRESGTTVADELTQHYQSRAWEKPVQIVLRQTGQTGERVHITAQLLDRNGITCLDARDFVRFGVTGNARLIDNLGTPEGSRKVQLANGRAAISAAVLGPAIFSVWGPNLPTAFLQIDPSAVRKEGNTSG